VYITHTHTHTHYDSSVQVISTPRKSLPTQHTTKTRDGQPCPQWDSNLWFQQSSGCRLTR